MIFQILKTIFKGRRETEIRIEKEEKEREEMENKRKGKTGVSERRGEMIGWKVLA